MSNYQSNYKPTSRSYTNQVGNQRNYKNSYNSNYSVRPTSQYTSSVYSDGNTLRYAQEAPVYEPRREQEQRPQRGRDGQRSVRKAPQLRAERKVNHGVMGARYTMYITVTAILIAALCVGFLSMRSTISNQASTISGLQKSISNLKIENDVTYGLITQDTNMEVVKDRAIELGMTYVESHQVLTYTTPVEDAVKQYENIPSSGVLPKSEKVVN